MAERRNTLAIPVHARLKPHRGLKPVGVFDRFRRNKESTKKRLSRPGLIGLDIGTENMHLCQLRPLDDNRYTIIAKSSIALPVSRQQLLDSPKVFKGVVQRAMKHKNFKGNRVTAIMPPDDVKIMLLSYQGSVQDVDSEVVNMLAQRLQGDIADYVIDYLPVRNSSADEEHIVMASATRREKVDAFLQLLESAGLQPDSLDIGPSALRRLISVLYKDDKTSNVMLINSAEELSYLTIVSGRRLLFDQPVKFGCNHLFRSMASTLDVPVDKAREMVFKHGINLDAPVIGDNELAGDITRTLHEIAKPAFLGLAEEINRVLIFTASETHGIPLSRIYLLGCIARLPGAHEMMMSMLDLPVAQNHPEFHDIFIDDNDNTVAWTNRLPELAVATGLALRGLQDDE